MLRQYDVIVNFSLTLYVLLLLQGSVTPPPGFGAPARKPSPTMTEVSKIDPVSISYDPKPSKSAARTSQTGVVSASQVKPVGGKQKQAFVPLMSAEGQSRATMQLPGRHGCSCLAQKHSLINNCTECGRIVCAQVSVHALA